MNVNEYRSPWGYADYTMLKLRHTDWVVSYEFSTELDEWMLWDGTKYWRLNMWSKEDFDVIKGGKT